MLKIDRSKQFGTVWTLSFLFRSALTMKSGKDDVHHGNESCKLADEITHEGFSWGFN
jgi:hypothetical protein